MARKRRGEPIHGWIVVDKPVDVTSTETVNRVRRHLNAAKAGHGGTLDPLASGVLPIALGEATKTVQFAMDGPKAYRFAVRWGEETETDDAEGATTRTSDVRPDRARIEAVLPGFTGEIEQIPPRYSAIKVDGARAYDLARDGDEVSLPARPVWIFSLRLIDMPDDDTAVFEAECGKGCYMRSLARDLARALGTVGHIRDLRRLSVGTFSLDAAVTLDDLCGVTQPEAVTRYLLPVEAALDDIPAFALTDTEAHRLRNGQSLALLSRQDRARLEGIGDAHLDGGSLLATAAGRPVALVRIEGATVKPVRVLNL